LLFNIKARTAQLKLKNNDIIAELNKRDIKCNQGEYSSAINGSMTTPKANAIVNMADEILKEYEQSRRK
jgi:hypothetical protein